MDWTDFWIKYHIIFTIISTITGAVAGTFAGKYGVYRQLYKKNNTGLDTNPEYINDKKMNVVEYLAVATVGIACIAAGICIILVDPGMGANVITGSLLEIAGLTFVSEAFSNIKIWRKKEKGDA